MPRVRHPKKDFETALTELEDAGWTVTATSQLGTEGASPDA